LATKRRARLDARADTVDFRDRLYEPTLVEVPTRMPPDAYRKRRIPILDQGTEGACTGFGLATVVHFLLRNRKASPHDGERVSPWMLYAMAKRYDEWPGEGYEGSSARGAVKGWHRHGVCAEKLWAANGAQRLTDERAADAIHRPLGAYLRVNHRDLVAMHAAIAEAGILYASATVHAGWDDVGPSGVIPIRGQKLGGHAFAIIGYDERGLWIQNSWGAKWGKRGLALVRYDDWLENATDVWVVRLAVPIELLTAQGTASVRAAVAPQAKGYAHRDLRPHIVSLGNDGRLRDTGPFATAEEDVAEILLEDFPRITASWAKKRLFLYAHGGLVGEDDAIQRVADQRKGLLDAEVYPLNFIWKTDFWTTLKNILEDALSRRRPEGFLDAAKDFMLDRLDGLLEPLARTLSGKAEWDEMKENALRASYVADGGLRVTLGVLAELLAKDPSIELHVAAHSAGSILCAPLVDLLTSSGQIPSGPLAGQEGLGRRLGTVTLWAPACTVDLFKTHYLRAIEAERVGEFSVFTLTDKAEQDDHCAHVYHKSLLYLVSNAFEEKPRIPWVREDGTPILGMEKFIRADAKLGGLVERGAIEWVRSPNDAPIGSPKASRSTAHGAFDDDPATLASTLALVLGRTGVHAAFRFQRGGSSLRDRRMQLAGR